jgi:hypothetical protein
MARLLATLASASVAAGDDDGLEALRAEGAAIVAANMPALESPPDEPDDDDQPDTDREEP